MPNWNNKTVLVTGGSSGFGKFIAQAFVQRGATVVITARDAPRLEAAAREIGRQAPPGSAGASPSHSDRAGEGRGRVIAIAADVTRDDDVRRLIEQTVAQTGRLDVLVNNAGRSDRGAAIETSLDDFRELLELNFLALARCTQLAAPHLLKSKGHLVNIGSLGAKTVSPYLGAYPVSKFPVAAYSQQLRLELGPQGLHVLLVCPGPIALPDSSSDFEQLAAEKQLPDGAGKPGGGVRLKGIDPARLAERIVRACERREAEIVVPFRARLLFAISDLWPSLGDWIIRKMTSES